MDTLSIIFSVVAAGGSLAAILFGISNYRRNHKHDAYKDGDQDGSIKGDIRYMRNGFDDLRLDVKEIGRKQSDQNERLIRCEERIETLFNEVRAKKKNGGNKNE